MVDAPRSQASLCDLKTLSRATNETVCRHTNILEFNLTVTVGGVVFTKDRQHAHNAYSRRIHGHQHHGMLVAAAFLRVRCIGHEDGNFGMRVTQAAGPPLAAIQYYFVTLQYRSGLHIGGIR